MRSSKSKNPPTKITPLSMWLSTVIDDLGIHNRQGWCTALGTSAQEINLWVTGQVLPRPQDLRGVVVLLRERYPEKPGVAALLKRWKQLEAFSLLDASGTPDPVTTLGSYVVLSLWDRLHDALDHEPTAVQERLLSGFVRTANQQRLRPRRTA